MISAQERLALDGHADSDPVLFFGKKGPEHKFYLFSNFSPRGFVLPCPFTGEDRHYPTGEHRYQAMKAETSDEHEYVRDATTAFVAKQRGREVKLRDYWGYRYGDFCYYVMLETILAKVSQNSDVAKLLKSTGDRPIYEDSPADDIWGWRHRDNYNGRNLLGRCLMQIREIL